MGMDGHAVMGCIQSGHVEELWLRRHEKITLVVGNYHGQFRPWMRHLMRFLMVKLSIIHHLIIMFVCVFPKVNVK